MGSTEMEVGADGVAVIRLVNPHVNDLSLDGNNICMRNFSLFPILAVIFLFLV